MFVEDIHYTCQTTPFCHGIYDVFTKCNNDISTLFLSGLISELTCITVPALTELYLLPICPEDCLQNGKKPIES